MQIPVYGQSGYGQPIFYGQQQQAPFLKPYQPPLYFNLIEVQMVPTPMAVMVYPQMTSSYFMVPQMVNTEDLHYPRKRIMSAIKTSQNLTCMDCNRKISTVIDRTLNTNGILFTLVMVCLFCPLFWIPLLVGTSYNHNHYCPSCRASLSYDI